METNRIIMPVSAGTLRKPAGQRTLRGPWKVYRRGTYAPDVNDRWLRKHRHGRKRKHCALWLRRFGATMTASLASLCGPGRTIRWARYRSARLSLIEGGGFPVGGAEFRRLQTK